MESYTSEIATNMSGHRHMSKTKMLTKSSITRFLKACEAADIKVESASPYKDIKEHTDYIINGQTVDLKSCKESAREGKVILELANVKGEKGWCNEEGLPMWIVFDFGAFFLWAKNSDLFSLAKEKCNLRNRVYKFDDCLYKGYQRKDRKDWMTMVTLQDVLNHCQHKFLPYPIILPE